MIHKLKQLACQIKRYVLALYFASQTSSISLTAKWMALAVIGYALSPVDLIPDFIPILGYLDEMILLPLGIYLTIKLIPEKLWHDCLVRADRTSIKLPPNQVAKMIIYACWLLLSIGAIWWIWIIFLSIGWQDLERVTPLSGTDINKTKQLFS